MAKTFEGTHPNAMYQDVTEYILKNGEFVAPRGMPTMEIQPAANVWTKPDQMVMTMPGRKPNPFFTLFESLWIAGGRGDSESVCFYNKQLAQFLDEGSTDFHAPYGRRIRRWPEHKDYEMVDEDGNDITQDQFADCYRLLKRDPDTRQAAMVLWNPIYDHSGVTTNDRPCNDLVFFKIRNGHLRMTVCNRSNDLHWGLYSTNIMQFSMMQRIMAGCLGVELGHYYHHSDSLHIYHERDDISERVLNAPYYFDVYDYLGARDLRNEWDDLEQFDKELAAFFECEEDFRKSSARSLFVDNKVRDGSFLHGALLICGAYVMHKRKEYAQSLSMILEAFEIGLQDHAVSCLEFVMRKYQSKKVGYDAEAIKRIAGLFQDYGMPDEMSGKILHYITNH